VLSGIVTSSANVSDPCAGGFCSGVGCWARAGRAKANRAATARQKTWERNATGERNIRLVLKTQNHEFDRGTIDQTAAQVTGFDCIAGSSVCDATSAADLKFLHRLPQTRLGTSNRKAALVSYAC